MRGIDTHKELHFAAVVDVTADVLATQAFATIRAGYDPLITWMRGFGQLAELGVEQTASYRAGVVRHLAKAGILVLEGTEPTRPSGAHAARTTTSTRSRPSSARAPASGSSVAKERRGQIEALRMLRTTRQTAVKARLPRCRSCATRSSPPPTKVRDPIRNLTLRQLIRALAASRPEARKFRDPPIATGVALRSLAHRILELGDEIHNLDATQRAARGRARPAIGEREQYVSLAFGQAAATPASLARWAPRATASPLSP